MSGEESTAPEIRRLGPSDREAALGVINEAARWYRDFLSPEEYREPEMTPEDWDGEGRRLAWYGAFETGTLVGVMGRERIRDVVLFRHAYIRPDHQRRGVGAELLGHLEGELAPGTRVVVGTYRKNFKARRALEKAGYTASADPEAVLRKYYTIPEDRLLSSLTYEKVLADR